MGKTISSLRSNFPRRAVWVWLCLLGFNLVLLVWHLPPLLRGEHDLHPNAHAIWVLSNAGQVFLCLSQIFLYWAVQPKSITTVRQKGLLEVAGLCLFGSFVLVFIVFRLEGFLGR